MNLKQSSSLNLVASTFSGMSMGTRLQEALDLRQRTAPDVIAACRLSKGAVYNILNDATKPAKVRAETVARIAGYLGVNRDWLVWGKGSPDDADSASDDGWLDVLGVQKIAQLGSAASNDGNADTHKLKFRAESLRRKHLDPAKLAVLRTEDDQSLLFDTSDVEPRDEKLYVVSFNGQLSAKRLLDLGGHWFITSENSSDPRWKKPVAIDGVKDFAIHGRVRWIGSWED